MFRGKVTALMLSALLILSEMPHTVLANDFGGGGEQPSANTLEAVSSNDKVASAPSSDGESKDKLESLAQVKVENSANSEISELTDNKADNENKNPISKKTVTERGATTDFITIERTPDTSYPTLEAALEAAEDGDVLEVNGKIVITKNVNITKSITLKAGSNGASISTSEEARTSTASKSAAAFSLLLESGKKLKLGDGTQSSELLLDEVHVVVSKGEFFMYDGAKISSNLPGNYGDPEVKLSIVTISGEDSKATFKGGTVENPYEKDTSNFGNNYILRVMNGAKVPEIAGGTYKGAYIALLVENEGTEISNITGGNFEHSSWTGQSEPCFKIHKKARVDKISGGTFKSYHFGALQLECGASVGEISGGTFQNFYEKANSKMYNGALPFCSGLVLYGREGDSPVEVHTISGGNFEGINGLLAIGSKPEYMAKIDKITGGTFKSIESDKGNAGLYFSQNSEIGEISGNVQATGRTYGIWNAGTIKKISGGTYTGQNNDGLFNYESDESKSYFKGNIEEISGGSFTGVEASINNKAVITKITNGIYTAKKETASGWNRDNYALNNKEGNGLIELEPDLCSSQPDKGNGRYLAFFKVNKDETNTSILSSNFVLPKYTGVDGTEKEYIMSGYKNEYKFNLPQQPENEQRTFNAYPFNSVLYVKTDKSSGAISWKDNDFFGQSEGYAGGKSYHLIYGLSQNYNNDAYLDNGYRYLTKQPVLSYDENFPKNTSTSGELPEKKREVKPFDYTRMSNGVDFQDGEPKGSLFCVKDNIGNLSAKGYKFQGWNTKKDGTGIWLYAGQYVAMPAENVTLYAQWKGTSQTVRYDANGGKFADGKAEWLANYQLNETINLMAAPSRDDYEFVAWEANGQAYKANAEYKVTGDVTFKAKWQKIKPKPETSEIERPRYIPSDPIIKPIPKIGAVAKTGEIATNAFSLFICLSMVAYLSVIVIKRRK